MKMNKLNYEKHRSYLVDRIRFNESIRCHRVAEKYKRMLNELDKEYENEGGIITSR